MFVRHRSLAGAIVLLAAVASSASAASSGADKIDADVDAVLHRFGVPGAAIMVIQSGHVSSVQGYGLRDIARRLPVRTDTLFEIGSITKQFTAASILQLQEAGKLQIDRPLSDYLPNAPHAKEVTLRQLLTLTAGLHDYFDGPPAEVERLAARPSPVPDPIARVASLPLDFQPGSRWSYSNTDYILLGRVIEAVSGQTYGDYLQRHVLDPLHMTDTHTMAEEDHLPNMAVGYRHLDGKFGLAPHVDPRWGGAAGFLVTTLNDLAKWDAALRGGKVVSMADYRLMTTSFVTTKNGPANYGFGFFVDSVFGQARVGHTGGSLAFTTADEYFPRQDVRIIAFTNLGDETPEAGETLTNVIFADLYPAIAAKTLTPAPGEIAKVTQTIRDAFRELQTGKSYVSFGTHLRGKLAGGAGAKFVDGLGPYGEPTAAIFKGIRREADANWYDYIIQFGPGVFIPFAATIGQDGTVSGISIG